MLAMAFALEVFLQRGIAMLPIAAFLQILVVCRCQGGLASTFAFLEPVRKVRRELLEAFRVVLHHGIMIPSLDVKRVHAFPRVHYAGFLSQHYAAELENIWNIDMTDVVGWGVHVDALPHVHDILELLRILNPSAGHLEPFYEFLSTCVRFDVWLPDVYEDVIEDATEVITYRYDMVVIHFLRDTLEGSVSFKASWSSHFDKPAPHS
jgi:hypothetical protein